MLINYLGEPGLFISMQHINGSLCAFIQKLNSCIICSISADEGGLNIILFAHNREEGVRLNIISISISNIREEGEN